jgi:penicillin amidase
MLILAASLAWAIPQKQSNFTDVTKFSKGGKTLEIPDLAAKVSVTTDREGVRHIEATNDHDLAVASGYVHCRDRLFQMDQTRRQVDGTEAELLGQGRLEADIQARILGLHRAAERTLATLSPPFQALLQAYSVGVNHCIDTLPLPPEYDLLELTQVRLWQAVDSVNIAKAFAASLSLIENDTELTEDLQAFVAAGIEGGFDGQLFFSADVFRSAPMEPASTVPDATNGTPFAGRWKADAANLASAAAVARRVHEKMKTHPLFAPALNRRERFAGSNEWGVTGSKSPGGRPIIANDPHLPLNIPSTFYEWHLVVTDDPEEGPLNVSGVGFPGLPGVIIGQNEYITWGAAVNPMDVSDWFSDTLHVAQPKCLSIGAEFCIESPPGTFHPVEIERGVTYFFNVIGDGIDNNLVPATGLPPEAQTVLTVPFRSFGPILAVEDSSVFEPPFGITKALVLQYTGFHATKELQAIQLWNRAQNLDDFLEGLAKFDVGSQNWAYADVDGNLAYFTSAEMPLRTDLEAGTVVGLPPFFVRDGTSGLNNWVPDPYPAPDQAIPFEILPFDEMPQTINPENDFFVNANNDPAGTTLDNDPLNQVRISNPNAIYYLNQGYADGLRAGRITQLIQDHPGRISVNDMKRFQSNTQQLDAELMTPFLQEAFDNASRPDAPIELADLADLASDPDIIEAVGRLAKWDSSTPTGIPEGYDAKNPNGKRPPGVPTPEARASVAATIYNMWRGQAIRSIIDDRLGSLGLGDNLPGSREALKALFNLLSQDDPDDPYTGIAAAGIDWIPEPATLSAAERRDLALLQALRAALDLLASDKFAPAFGESTDQDDYRWGKLHRIVFEHPFEDEFNIPPQAGFNDVGPGLRGLARDGGYEVVNASSFSARGPDLDENLDENIDAFMFDHGPVRRYVGEARTGPGKIAGVNVVPGGPSGIPGDPNYATQLGTWLTADYHTVEMGLSIPPGLIVEKETFVPAH